VIAVSTATAIEDRPLPNQFALHTNVPNPFNPQTTIHYDVPASGADVNISIYDVAGRLVRELANEQRAAGRWSVQWNGDDDRSQRVASGVYFYRMRAGSFVDTKKMVLLK
jgi:flagellar hook assembly protein FlgD